MDMSEKANVTFGGPVTVKMPSSEVWVSRIVISYCNHLHRLDKFSCSI